ncbi:hypothetical protein C8R44DRAFT_941473 [Mycena epipterygia]|nr:hypothetical protein C8R44DRAFT_941473 [Mycena epipterygia]
MADSKSSPDSYLVLGGTKVGRCVANLLAQRGETRIAIFDAAQLDLEQAILPFLVPDCVQILVGDISNADVAHNTVKSVRLPTQIQHIMTIQPCKAKAGNLKVNVDTTRHVLDASWANGVKKLVYMSNPDAFFDGSERPMLTERAATFPKVFQNEILESKARGERQLCTRSKNGRHPPCGGLWVRFPSFPMMECTPKIAGHQVGDNTNLVDRVNFTNVAHALILAADRLDPSHPKHAAVAGKGFFTDGAPRPFFDFYHNMWAELTGAAPKVDLRVLEETLTGRRLTLLFSYMRGDPPKLKRYIRWFCTSRSYDITLAREALDYVPLVSYDAGIRETVQVIHCLHHLMSY